MGCGLSMSYDLFFKSLNDNDTAYPEGGRVMAVSQCFIVGNRHESRYRLYYNKVTRVRSASQTGQGISCGKVQRVSQLYVSLVSGGSHVAAKCIEILFNYISRSYYNRLIYRWRIIKNINLVVRKDIRIDSKTSSNHSLRALHLL